MVQKLTSSLELKQKNRSHVFQLLYKTSGLTRQDIVARLQLSLPTVTQNLEELQAEGLICEDGSKGNTGGRRAKTYALVANARTAIGLDITKGGITAVAVDLLGNIVARVHESVQFSKTEAYYRRVGHVIDLILRQGKLDKDRVLGVGIGVPGLITPDHQKVFYGEILQFTDATCMEFSEFIPFRANLYNDANAAGFAESWVRPDLKNAFYLMLSNNVGGAIYINNRQYNGDNTRSGEVGHIQIVPNGKLCYCGQRGCVDAYCAATVLSGMTNGDLNVFFAKLERKDPKACAVWREYLQHLSVTVANVRMLLDCNIILGGYVGEYIDPYLDELKALAARLSGFEDTADYLLPCSYKKEAIAAGAALSYIAEFVKSI